MTPDEYTNEEVYLDVGHGHKLYAQDWGNKAAEKPIIFLHGGPGSGCKDRYRQPFDPKVQRVIFFDQRGSGKSTPLGSIEHNTTDDVIEDIEKVADHFKLTKFILTGGSWGSCLALAYALKHPERITAMVLRGIYTARRKEIDWIEQGGFRALFPDVWDTYVQSVPKAHQDNPSAYHVARILGNDAAAAKESAYRYGNLEASVIQLDDRFMPSPFDEFDPTTAKLEAYYQANDCFLPEGYILKEAHRLTMPIWLIQGRYDMVCPPITAYELSKQLPHARLIWTTAGHGNDRPTFDVTRAILLQLAGN